MYAKVFSQIYDGTLCTKGPWEALVTFQQFLVLADMDGCVDMTAAAISRRTTIPLEIIERGIAELIQPDPESRTPTEEGRRLVLLAEGRHWGWRVVNYAHYRDLKREEDRREYHRQYWHKRKAKDSTDSTDSTENSTPQHIQKQKQKQKKETNTVRKSAAAKRLMCVEDLVAEGVDQQSAEDWLTNRKAKDLPLTRTAWKQTKDEAARAGMSIAQAIGTAAGNGWGGFKAAWVEKANGHDPFAGAA